MVFYHDEVHRQCLVPSLTQLPNGDLYAVRRRLIVLATLWLPVPATAPVVLVWNYGQPFTENTHFPRDRLAHAVSRDDGRRPI